MLNLQLGPNVPSWSDALHGLQKQGPVSLSSHQWPQGEAGALMVPPNHRSGLEG